MVVSCKTFGGLIAGDFAAIARDRPILSKVAFLFSVSYGIACGILGVRILKVLTLDIKVNARILTLLPDIPEELREGYVAPLDFNVIIRHDGGLLFVFCESQLTHHG